MVVKCYRQSSACYDDDEYLVRLHGFEHIAAYYLVAVAAAAVN